MKLHWLALLTIGLASSASALANETTKAAPQHHSSAPVPIPAYKHVVYNAVNLKWSPGPPSLPPGAKVAVVQGDPTAPGTFTMRVKIPAGYKVRPHSHPADENVTVLSGDFHMAVGDTWDVSKGHTLTAGGFSSMPHGMHHYAWTSKGCVFQVHGMGPFGITYVNPADDPRTAPKTASK
jgi:quercetin dioxygenase-like cupin family protein